MLRFTGHQYRNLVQIQRCAFSATEGAVLRPDVCIVGGGPNGAALACTLAKSQYFGPQADGAKSILLLDNTRLPEMSSYASSEATRVPEPRVVTLSPASLRLLKSIDALQACDHRFITPFYDMLVYEQAGGSYMRFNNQIHRQDSPLVKLQELFMNQFLFDNDRQEVQQDYMQQMGASIENQHLLAGLLEQLNKSGKCEIVPSKVASIEQATSSAQLPTITLEDGSKVMPKLIVGSDGKQSMTRKEHKIETFGHSYGQKGLVCTVSSLQPNEIAFQRFLETGPLAVLPLWGSYSSIVWSCPDELCQELQSMSESDFVSRINNVLQAPSQSIGAIPDKILPSQIKRKQFETPPLISDVHTKRYAFPLALQMSNQYVSHRMALIGDAAHSVHPLAGQGLNLGISDVAYLSNAILKAKKGGQDIGDLGQTLRTYEKTSKANAYMIAGAIEFVKKSYDPGVFGKQHTVASSVLAAARNGVIDLIETSDFAKYNFMNFAAGSVNHPAVYEWNSQ